MKRIILCSTAIMILAIAISTQILTIIVVQPIGAIPKGSTAVFSNRENLNFIDSADAICIRRIGGVSLLCRGAVLSQII